MLLREDRIFMGTMRFGYGFLERLKIGYFGLPTSPQAGQSFLHENGLRYHDLQANMRARSECPHGEKRA